MVSGFVNAPGEGDKRVRREIANSNERRRMQSINAGFEQLKVLLPSLSDSDKLSKANILKLTAKYINSLLNRINVLENEVSLCRGTAESSGDAQRNINCKSHPETHRHGMLSGKKRKLVDRRSPVRRKRLDDRVGHTPNRNFSPVESKKTHTKIEEVMPQLSPVAVNADLPQYSPQSDISSTSKLDHLVMAIEKIEGNNRDFSCSSSPVEDLIERMDPPKITIAASKMMRSTQECLMSEGLESLIMPSSGSFIVSTNSIKSLANGPVGFPIVAKILNRSPIPHKYLHRPQVVVNSSN